ncbi:MAG TPA: ABC transporter permease [Verrucomicrobiae bacterium]|nr:ABC transporter permease [Verrucomicrobiae bacterium]
MNWLVKKEIRLLLPAWIAAMLLAIVAPWVLPVQYALGHSLGSLIQLLFPLGVLILAITPFGQEFNSGAISTLLAQPLDRRRIWRTKTTILALAFLIVCLAAFGSFLCRFNAIAEDATNLSFNGALGSPAFWAEFRLDTLEGLAISALVSFSGGLWTTLLFRQMTAAFWFTLLIPGAIAMIITAGLQVFILSESCVNWTVIIVLVAYSIAGFFFARRLFLYAKDTQWTGGNISFAWRTEAGPRTARPASRPGNWISVLLLKEIHVHQVNICIAGVLLAFQLSCLAALTIYPHFSRDTAFALKSVWVIWFFMPILIGSSPIAEERRLGVMETQLCLPASRRAQWFAKLSVALVLSLLFGSLIPFATIKLGGADYSDNPPAALFLIYPFAMSLVSIYASSLVRSTLLAIGTAMAITAILWVAGTANVTWNFGDLFLNDYDYGSKTTMGLSTIILFLGLPVLLVVLARLTFWNFKWLHEGSKLWRRNIILVFATVLSMGILANAIYFRSWEFATSIEPAQGPARLDHATKFKFGSFNSVFTVLPDGRIWSDMVAYHDVSNLWWQTTVLVPKNNDSRFIGGSNWADVAVDNIQLLGIHSDGTLWSIQRKWDPSRSWWRQSGPVNLAQIGSDMDWTKVAGGQNSFMLLKRDGSLWRWGTNDYDWKHEGVSIPKKLELDRAMMPSRVGAETDWLDLFSSRRTAYAKKRDGSLWRWEQSWGAHSESGLVPVSEANTNGPWSSIAFCEGDSFAEINTNGELWLFVTRYGSGAAVTKSRVVKIRLGENAKWKICGNESWNGIWAIRNDGTLWKWPPVWAIQRDPQLNPIQLGSRSDWLALSDAWQFGLSLAADGSVWAWGQPSRHIWLAPPRKPVYMGNIFEGAGN